MIVLAYVLFGLALGAGSSVLPGPCGLAVMRATTRAGLARGVATGLGAAAGDFIYATLGVLGVGRLLTSHPALPPVLQTVSGVVLIGYGVHHLRSRGAPLAAPATQARGCREAVGAGFLRGFAVGLSTLLANPGAMLTWVVIIGSLLCRASDVEAWLTVVGIGAGSAAWFSLVALLTHRGRLRFAALVARIATAVSCLLVASGVLALARAGLAALGTGS